LLLAASASVRAQDVAPEDHAFVEIVASKETCFVGETIDLRLRVGFDVAFFEKHSVQMFARPLDVPVSVEAPWLRHPVGATVGNGAFRTEGLSFALDDDVADAELLDNVARNGRAYRVIELAQRCTPSAPGDLSIPAPTMRFAYAERFEDDFVHGRMPVGRRDAVVRGTPLTIRVSALPDTGRPQEFTGSIGKFTIAAEATPRDVAVGETIKLRLTIRGDATSFDAPRVADLSGLHVYGVIERSRGTFEYDVAPLRDDVTSIPPIAFAYFDPDAAQYRVVKTDAIPLRVRPSTTPSRPTTDVAEHEQSPLRWIALETAAAGLAVVCIVLVRRARAKRASDDETPHVRDAAAAFRALVDGDDADAFAAFLAACLRCPSAAVISPDLGARLVAAGAPADVADRAAALLERLVAARYGGDASADDASAARAVGDEIEATLS